jgi:hypothetical protein
MSDHFGIKIEQKLNVDINLPTILKRKFLNNKLASKLHEILKLENWSTVYQTTGTENKFVLFNNLFLKYLDEIISVSISKSDNKRIKESRKYDDQIATELTEQVKLFEEMLIQTPGNLIFRENLSKSKSKLKAYLENKSCINNSKLEIADCVNDRGHI